MAYQTINNKKKFSEKDYSIEDQKKENEYYNRNYEIKPHMRKVIKEGDKKDLYAEGMTKEQIFSQLKGDQDRKEEILKQLIDEGEIYENKPNHYRWLN